VAVALGTLLGALPAVAQTAADAPSQAAAQDAYELPLPGPDPVVQAVQRQLDAADARFDEVLQGALEPAANGDGAPDAVEVDLAGAVALALRQNPSLAAVEARRDEVAAGVREVKADAIPQLTATSSYGASRNPSLLNSPDFEDIIAQFPGGDFTPAEQRLYDAGLELSQPLYTFGKISAAIDLARLVVDATEAQIGAARLDTAIAAAEAYYDVLTARESLGVALVQRRVRRDALAVVRARYEIGEATRLEVLRAQSAVAEVTPEVARLAGDLAVARSRLANALGLPPGTPLTVNGGVEVSLPALGETAERKPGTVLDTPSDSVPGSPDAGAEKEPGTPMEEGRPRHADDLPPVPSLAELDATARANRPEIADLELQQQVLLRRQTVTRAESRPQLELNGFFGRQARLFDNLGNPLYDNYSVSVGLRWELFDGGRRKGQIAQLESQRQQLGHRLRDLLGAIRQELEESRTAYRTAQERWRAAETAATAAREASRVARESYREGVALQTDWLDAQRQETEAEILAVEAYYDARKEAARLARSVGSYPTEGWTGPAAREAAEE
jgi:HAE1 family hydrophobic/amphiphilic exporter-1